MMQTLLHRLPQLEDAVFALLLGSMISLAVLQIVLRNVVGTSLTWIDPLLRVEVLWLGLLGAAAAARTGRHITIDLLEPVLKETAKQRLARAANFAAAIVCAVVAWYSYQFVLLEKEFPTAGVLGLPTWAFQTVIPFSFGLMSVRFVLMSFLRAPRSKAG